jgi:tetratricopeptide (TPR) repeat protein
MDDKAKTKNKAIDCFTEAIKLNGAEAEYYYLRGYLYLDLFKNDQAMADLNKALELNPKHGEAYFERGNLYYRSKDFKRQIAEYDKAIAAVPQSGKFYYWRGDAKLQQLKDKEGACADFNKALELGYKRAEAMKDICALKGRTYIAN